jgi:hypothetical protein
MSARKPLKPCPRGNDECPIDCCVRLSVAQARVMDAYWQGRSDEIKSGPALAACAAIGLLARADNGIGSYEPTEYARRLLMARGARKWSEFSSDQQPKE